MHGRAIPAELRTVRKLRENATDFNPFSPLVIYGQESPPPDEFQMKPHQFVKGWGIRCLVKDRGLPFVRKLLKRMGGGHVREQLKNSAAFLPRTGKPFPMPDFYQLYRADVLRQINGDMERGLDELAG
jgi:hypothetical protein